MKAGTQNHVKVKRLKRLLGIPLYRAVGILETLWLLCIDCADEGEVGKFTDGEIADYLEWDGDPSQLVRALSESGWTDTDDNGRPVIHDWLMHCPKFIQERVKKRRARVSKSSKSADSDHEIMTYVSQDEDRCGTSGVLSPGCPDLPILVPSIPNPTQPNPTNYNPANPPANHAHAASHSDDATQFGDRLADGLAGNRSSGWGLVADRLSSLGASRWREAIEEAKQCGCTPGHAMEVIAYAKQNGFQVGAIIYRLSRARPSLPLGEGWPGKPQGAVAAERKAASKAERLLRERAEADATAMIKALRKQQMPDGEILKRLEAAGLEWPK